MNILLPVAFIRLPVLPVINVGGALKSAFRELCKDIMADRSQQECNKCQLLHRIGRALLILVNIKDFWIRAGRLWGAALARGF
jgi:hypothetical protein